MVTPDATLPAVSATVSFNVLAKTLAGLFFMSSVPENPSETTDVTAELTILPDADLEWSFRIDSNSLVL